MPRWDAAITHAELTHAEADLAATEKRVVRSGPSGDVRYDQWDLLDAGRQALQKGAEGVRVFCDRWLGIRKRFEPEHLMLACCEIVTKLAPREAWRVTEDDAPQLVEPLPPFWQESKDRPDDYVAVAIRRLAEKYQQQDEEPLWVRSQRLDVDVEMLEAFGPSDTPMEFEALMLARFEVEEATPAEAELLVALRRCGGSPADALSEVGRPGDWSAWQSFQRRIRRFAVNAAA